MVNVFYFYFFNEISVQVDPIFFRNIPVLVEHFAA